MATITGQSDERVFQIQRWLGLNENPDGDTKLKMGEASYMRNFRVTRDGNLQKRPGCAAIGTVTSGKAIDAVWTDGLAKTLVICDKKLYKLDDDLDTATLLHTFTTVDKPHMFAFNGKVYILNGGTSASYWVYDGSTVSEVSGYIPLVAVAVTPSGGGDLLEQVNKLTAKRRVWLSPDGVAATFQLPEKDLDSVDGAVLTSDGTTAVTISSSDLVNGTVTFAAVPAAGTSTIQVSYTTKADFRSEIAAMKFSETYNGAQDTRVFLYGDGGDTALYSDVDYDGQPSAEYFPDQNEVKVGATGSPITAMIRHYGTLAVYKTDGAYSISYGSVALADGSEIGAFYVTPVNATIGNEAPGQAQLVLNSPVTLFGQDAYQWTNSSYYTSNLTRDERQAKRVSDRVYSSLHGFTTADCVTFDDNYNQEYYICDPATGQALVWNYAADAWYLYTDFPMWRPFSYKNELYFGGKDGRIYCVHHRYNFDHRLVDGSNTVNAISCYWESGAMSFGKEFQRKNSAMLWLGFKPEAKTAADVTVLTDKELGYPVKSISHALFDWEHVDFEDWTFDTSDKPQLRRMKIKAKKFLYYKLAIMTESSDTTVTVTAADIRVRFMGYAK